MTSDSTTIQKNVDNERVEQPCPTPTNNARRKLLKGLLSGLSGPVILTLSSGSAIASSSSRCIDLTLTTDGGDRCVPVGTPGTDVFVRRERLAFFGDDAAGGYVMTPVGGAADTDLCYIYVNPDGTPAPNTTNDATYEYGRKIAAPVAGVDPVRITQSCWTSFGTGIA
ncbi:MAG: hypothetical protein HQL94_03260 [Magnetococcales bacterium]|nr:hypothetical protein [Magnetococcales bacterium]MBF0438092.1 hypothetical protein [Magnetococcales bacterium]